MKIAKVFLINSILKLFKINGMFQFMKIILILMLLRVILILTLTMANIIAQMLKLKETTYKKFLLIFQRDIVILVNCKTFQKMKLVQMFTK